MDWHQLIYSLHHLTHEAFDTQWAYLVLFVWTIFEGETCLLLAGACCADAGNLRFEKITLCILAAFLGSLTGDQLWFQIGRHKGEAALLRRESWRQKAQKVYRLLERHNTWLILGFRFLYGLRTITPFAIGMSNVPTKRFLVLNSIGAAVWAISFGMAGYLFGRGVATYFDDPKHKIYRTWAILAVAAVVFAIWLTRGIVRAMQLRRARRRQEQTPAEQPVEVGATREGAEKSD